MVIRNKEDFLKWFTEEDADIFDDCYSRANYQVSEENPFTIIDNITLEGRVFENKSIWSIKLKNFKFIDCEFKNNIFHGCIIADCIFENCTIHTTKFLETDLRNCNFNSCSIYDVEIADTDIKNVKFEECFEIADLKFRGFANRELKFTNCSLHHLTLEALENDDTEKYYFENCVISKSLFDQTNLSESLIRNCSLSLNHFSSCTFSNHTIENLDVPGEEYNMIDIRTILKSPNFNENILEKGFGITNTLVKQYLEELTTEIHFQSIFISYSLKDSNFAEFLSSILNKKGIMTFLWENDAPGGKPLKAIMSENVNAKDRVLFIASKNSLKSEACHFELSEGRKKQEITWEDVLFPIHVDNFLFEVKKDNIRPNEKQEEYWRNITELKNLNSLDFSKFVLPENRDHNFDKQLFKLIKGLRK